MDGEYLEQDGANQLSGVRLIRGKTNPVNDRLESSILVGNREKGAAIMRFKVYDNPDFAQKLYDYLNSRESIKIENR